MIKWLKEKLKVILMKKLMSDPKRAVNLQNAIAGLNENYLFDFHAGFSNGFPTEGVWRSGTGGRIILPDSEEKEKIPIAVKPIDVLNELETIPNPFTLQNLDGKIAILENKISLIKQEYTKQEVSDLIGRLKNRKKYSEYFEFFNKFQNTDTGKINDLCEKYNLAFKPSDIFIPEFPDEAITIMKEYEEMVVKITSKKPIFYVIATQESFRVVNKKRDPILLVQSPFGFYWQILGAWDKEMQMLIEL